MYVTMSYERKTKMKRILALLLALVMVCAFAACGGNKDAGTDTGADTGADTNAGTDADAGASIEGGADASADAGADDAVEEEPVTVMTHDEYEAAALDTQVVVETYVQNKQGWWEKDGVGGVASFYTQAEDGAYFIYDMPCSKEDYDKMVPGTKLRVTGYTFEWAGEIEIIDATYEILDGSFIATALDATELLGTEELIAHQNEFVSFTNMVIAPSYDAEGNEVAFLYSWDGSGAAGDDIYFNASIEGDTYTFVIESYLTGDGTEVYEAVEAIEIGTLVNMEGYLYWYEGAQPHIISVTVPEMFTAVDETTEAGVDAYLQGTWEWTDDNGIYFEVLFDAGYFSVTSEIGGSTISNEGSYKICNGAILITYTNGQMAYMEYVWNGSEITDLYALIGM